MFEVSEQMGVTPPTKDDLKAILAQLDEDFDGVIDKDEFHQLVVLVIGRMLETEEQTQNDVNDLINSQLKNKEKPGWTKK